MVGNITQIKSGKTINVGVSTKEHHVCKKGYIGNLSTWSCKKGKYVGGGIIDGSVITCDETIDVARLDVTWVMRAKSYGKATKTVLTKSTLTKMVPIKIILTNFYILLNFSLITIGLLMAVSIYCLRITKTFIYY